MTVEDYNKILLEQKGMCAICGINQSELKNHLYVDHNHKTGEIRGLLCNNCNVVLGYVKDNSLILIKAIEYLQNIKCDDIDKKIFR